MKTNLMQLLRLVLMVLAVAGVIYAIEFMERGIAVWFWVVLSVSGSWACSIRSADAALRGPGKSRAAAARKEAQPPFETLTGA